MFMTTSQDPRDRLIVALDTGPEDALRLARELAGTVVWVKVGMTLFYLAGPSIVAELRSMGFRVFLDLKLHDIPHQVRGAARSVASLGAAMLTVHASGGAEMIAQARAGAHEGAHAASVEPPAVIAVTVLTSMDDQGLHSVGVERGAAEQVGLLARQAADAGADGVVCSPLEAGAMRGLLGAEALIVTPGVRPSGGERGDQSRVATPADALAAGASHLVVGRPITEAADPRSAALSILKEMKG